jgi:ACS family glucarate transporter-like MFS transporter
MAAILSQAPELIRASTSSARRRVIALGASLAFLSFLDRAAISQAAPAISKELHLSTVQMGLVFSSFGITYALGEIPSGWLCDRLGARKLLTRVVLFWSLLTAATGAVWSLPSLVAVRLLFGAGESGCFPALARVFRTWLSPSERNAAEGIKAASARWGAALTPALIAGLSAYFSWRQIFGLFGLLGAVWAAVFVHWYRDSPPRDDLPEPAAEYVYESVATDAAWWGKLLRSRSVWCLGIQWFCHYYGFYFYITWLPIYLYQVRGLDLRKGALAAGLPLFSAGLGCLLSGYALTALARHLQNTAKARKWLGYLAYGGAGLLLLLFTQIANPLMAVTAMSLSSFAAEFSSPISWTTAMDIGGDRVGTVSGFMNMLGHLGGTVAPSVVAVLVSRGAGGWNTAFGVSAAIYGAGALCWVFIDPVRDLGAETRTASAATAS